MKKWILSALAFTYCLGLIAQDASIIYNSTVGSTVTIETNMGLGSGFFVAPNIIATNYHVIEGTSEAFCYSNNSTVKYKIDGYFAVDKNIDLILLNVPNLSKPPLKLASQSVSPGQQVYVIGSPKGLPATISDGIVSGMRDFDGYKVIQMTAPISPGSSGGPVLNSKGELIGISVMQFTEGQNLNFAIPKSYLELLLQFRKSEAESLVNLNTKNTNYTSIRKEENPEGDGIYLNPSVFTRPNASSFLLKSNKFNVGTYLDSKKWTIEKGKGDDAFEYQLTLNQGDLYAMMITEQVEIPLESLKEIALDNARDVAPDVYVVKEEYRMVNGLRVLMLQMNGTLSGIKFSYYGYYFSSEKGTIQFIGYTSQNLLAKYQKTIEDLLNGLVQY